MRTIGAAVCVVLLVSSAAQAAQKVEAGGKVEAVTLYRGQALVTRAVRFDAPAGAVQLTVAGLPDAVLGDSLFASGGKDVEVRAVRYRETALGEAPQEEVRKLDEQIADVEKKVRENEAGQQLAQQSAQYVAKLEGFVAPTAQVEMSKGVLNADTLEKVSGMILERRAQLSKQTFTLTEEARDLKRQLELVQRKRAELTRSYSKIAREAIIFLDKTGAGQTELRVSYMVQNATWSPTYNLRAGAGLPKAAVEYGSLVQQMSGEDWEGVALTLSTAGARMVADGPVLAPLRLALSKAPAEYGGAQQVEQRLTRAKSDLRSAQVAQQRTTGFGYQQDVQWRMNEAAATGQNFELGAKAADVSTVQKLLYQRGSGLSVNYKIEGSVSVASRAENQMVQIATFDLPAKFFYEATPLLTEYVYRYADLTNDSARSLLEGRANVYLDGDFVGTASVPMVARGQKVTVGFGTDPQLRAWREFVAKDEKSQFFGGNKEISYRYRLVLDNYSQKPVVVHVLDRIPVETDQVRVKPGDMTEPLSKDAEYVRMLRPQGILRWDVEVPAKAAGGSAKTIGYAFTLEFDKDLHIAVPESHAMPAQAKEKFIETFNQRNLAQ